MRIQPMQPSFTGRITINKMVDGKSIPSEEFETNYNEDVLLKSLTKLTLDDNSTFSLESDSATGTLIKGVLELIMGKKLEINPKREQRLGWYEKNEDFFYGNDLYNCQKEGISGVSVDVDFTL